MSYEVISKPLSNFLAYFSLPKKKKKTSSTLFCLLGVRGRGFLAAKSFFLLVDNY